MEQAIQIFSNPEFGSVRIVEINGVPYFVGSDVATALGYVDTFGALKKHVDDEDKTLCQIDSGSRGLQSTTVINESGVYSLILRSNLPKARDFKRWVTSVVLPTIRKTGMYIDASRPISGDQLILIGQRMKELEAQNALLQVQNTELQPKADYCDVILQCKDLVITSVIAKDYGYSAKSFNKLLHELGIQFKQSGIWLLYQKYAAKGWTQTKTHKYMGGDGEIHCKAHTYWTQKGRIELYHILKRNGILPVIER